MSIITVCAFVGVFFFCCFNIYVLEILIREDSGIGNLVTFVQFLTFSIHGFIFTFKFGTAKRRIPLNKYGSFVILYFLSSFMNNYAFNFNVPMPLHIILRSGSLIANLLLGIYILKRTYSPWKYVSVTLITIGIIICTLQTGNQLKKENSSNEIANNTTVSDLDNNLRNVTKPDTNTFSKDSDDLFWMCVGVGILTVSLFLSARMGIFQETLYTKYGKHPYEALFYTHILPLPLFLAIGPNLINHWNLTGETEPILDSIPIPSARFYLLINTLSQCLCISCVYILTSECTSLVVTLTLTLRKFTSLVFSVIYFKNPFTHGHWIGALFVLVGTCVFTEVVTKIMTEIQNKMPRDTSEEELLISDSEELLLEDSHDPSQKDLSIDSMSSAPFRGT